MREEDQVEEEGRKVRSHRPRSEWMIRVAMEIALALAVAALGV